MNHTTNVASYLYVSLRPSMGQLSRFRLSIVPYVGVKAIKMMVIILNDSI